MKEASDTIKHLMPAGTAAEVASKQNWAICMICMLSSTGSGLFYP